MNWRQIKTALRAGLEEARSTEAERIRGAIEYLPRREQLMIAKTFSQQFNERFIEKFDTAFELRQRIAELESELTKLKTPVSRGGLGHEPT